MTPVVSINEMKRTKTPESYPLMFSCPARPQHADYDYYSSRAENRKTAIKLRGRVTRFRRIKKWQLNSGPLNTYICQQKKMWQSDYLPTLVVPKAYYSRQNKFCLIMGTHRSPKLISPSVANKLLSFLIITFVSLHKFTPSPL